jgi:hypothetical protein
LGSSGGRRKRVPAGWRSRRDDGVAVVVKLRKRKGGDEKEAKKLNENEYKVSQIKEEDRLFLLKGNKIKRERRKSKFVQKPMKTKRNLKRRRKK